MGKQYDHLSSMLQDFINQQHIFFVATAGADGRVNVSPKGMDSLRILNPNRAVWLSVTGSGNETAAHVAENGRMTIMFCAFEGRPMILRLYGSAQVIHPRDADWDELVSLFPKIPGTRQIFDLNFDLVQTSCGMAVPLYDFQGQRDDLIQWADRKGDEGLEAYWTEKNQLSLDQKPTYLLTDSPVPVSK
jgi:hypothetical protein